MKKFAATVFAAFACLFAFCGAVEADDENPHAFFADADRCVECHVETKESGKATVSAELKKDLVGLCFGCHDDKDLSALHPVEIRPEGPIPKALALDADGAITCGTCHEGHGPYESDRPYVAESLTKKLFSLFTTEKKYRTFFLRMPNDEGQLCLSCHKREVLSTEGFHVREESLFEQYAGSQACEPCHGELYAEWKKTPHARIMKNARKDPSVVVADFETNPPFPKEVILYTVGSHWSQRYVVEKNGELYVKAPIWLILKQEWDRSSWIDKPYTQYCFGCHATGVEVKGKLRFVELGVGCEECHGPAKAHVESNGTAAVVNPDKLNEKRRDMICESCHTSGHDRTGQFRFPVGYVPGRNLELYFQGLMPKIGQSNDTFAGDGSYEDRHRQWLFWVETFLNEKGLGCKVCGNFRQQMVETEKKIMTPSQYCMTCHKRQWPPEEMPEIHAEHHLDVDCRTCHTPRTTASGKRYSIHDHKFMFSGKDQNIVIVRTQTCDGCHAASPSVDGG